MVTLEPDFEQVLEVAVICDVGRRQVRVIVHNRLVGCVVVIEPPGYVRVEKEVIVDEVQREDSPNVYRLELFTAKIAKSAQRKQLFRAPRLREQFELFA